MLGQPLHWFLWLSVPLLIQVGACSAETGTLSAGRA